MARPSDLEKMTFAELTEMEARIERLKAEKQNAERTAVRKQLMDLAKEHGFDIRELLDGRKKGKGSVAAKYRDPKNPPAWVGMDVYGAAICFNTVEAQKLGLPKPETWKDLTKPVYKGRIVMPNPASSGTGYLDVTGWIQMWGEADAWKYMDALHDNIAQYTHSGSKPCRQAGAGEFPIGVSFEYRAVTTKKSGAPIDVIFPTEGLGWDLESSGIVKGTKKLDAAKAMMDWLATPEAMSLYAKNFAVLAVPGMAKPLEFVPADYEKRLIKNDFSWSAKNRDKIIGEWLKRYDGKSEPKS